MRLHRLQIQAFGPFPERVDIDFDELTSSGLFLLHGPTGAGKTSILDAVCFALYAQVPGNRQNAKRLHSDHAAPGTRPEVILEFSARGRRFEVTRSPEWWRPVKRGTGTTREGARSLLREKANGEWLEGTRDHKETALTITSLLGMKVEQFTRVVLLPQGDFAKFLQADSRQRGELLEQLFATDRFSRIENRLIERFKDAEADVASLSETIDRLVTRARQSVAGVAEEPFTPEPDDSDGARTYLAVLRETLTQLVDNADEAAQARANDVAAARTTRDELTARTDRHTRFNRLLSDRDEFEAAQADRDADDAALEAHRRASGVGARIEAYDDAAAASERARESLAAAESAAERTLDDSVPSDIESLGAELVRLEDLRSEEDDNESRKARADELDRHVAAERRALETDRATEAELTNAVHTKRAELDELRDTAALRTARADENRRADDVLDSARQAERLRSELEAARNELRAAVDTEQSRREEHLDIRRRRLDGMASELAAGLADGAACPVCGSREHPDPAARPEDAPGDAEERQAQADADTAAQARHDHETTVNSLHTKLGDAVARSGDTDTPTAELRRNEAARLADESRDAAERVATISQAIDTAETELATTRAAIAERLPGIDETAGEILQLRRNNAAFDEKRTGLTGDESIADAIKRVSDTRAALQHLGTAAEAVERSSSDEKAALDAARRAATAASFAEIDAARAARLDDEDERALLARQRTALDRAAELRTRAKEPEIKTAEREASEHVGPPTDEEIRAAQRTLDDRQTRQREADRRQAVLARSLDVIRTISGELNDSTKSVGEVMDRYQRLRRLSDLARGGTGNDMKMSLSTYVLAARLEAVAAAATTRLLVMSEGRYGLRHTDALADRGRRSGLGLEVLDAHTGTARDPRTLSGGESFQASLALALGLADVVQAESGGVDLETLFIDEGFGSLDEASLDLVLDTLDSLRAGGRAVGVISHVREMKNRIMSRLEVAKAPHGSTVAAVQTP